MRLVTIAGLICLFAAGTALSQPSEPRLTFRLVIPLDLEGQLEPSTHLPDGVFLPTDVESEPRLGVAQAILLSEADIACIADVSDRPPGELMIGLKFTPEGAQRFEAITREHVGRRIAIVLDGRVLTAPVVYEAITDGRATVSGAEALPSKPVELAENLGIAICEDWPPV